jgi:hypothetical protein
MKIKLLSCLLILLVGLPAMAAAPNGRSAQISALTVDNETFMAANNIGLFVTNHGNFGRDLAGVFGNDYGTYFPYTGDANIRSGVTTSPYYAGGLWVGAVDQATGDTLTTISEYSSEYVPGPSLAGTFQTDRPEFRVYRLYKDSLADNPNADYLTWPVDQGAPTRPDTVWNADSTVDEINIVPDLIGDQMAWSIFNDFDPDQHTNMETAPLGLDIKQTVFAFERTNGALANIIFLRYRIYNTGSKTLTNCFFSIWSDPDLGTAGDDLVGCDTLLNLGYTYNEANVDPLYSQSLPPVVPAIGIDFFQGPLVFTDSDADTAKMWGTTWPGYTNMGLYSFNKYINGTDPDDYQQTYAYMKGLRAKTPGFPPYQYNGVDSRFMFSGDPVTGKGDLDFASDDRRHMQTTGPVTFAPGDSTEILAAMVIGQGGDRLSSITVMKGIDAFAQRLYELDFKPPEPPAKPVVEVIELPGEITLRWGDTSEVDPGDYEFEGYTIWQGASAAGPWKEIATFDLVNERIGGLVDTLFNPEAGVPLPTPMRGLKNGGLAYTYTFDRDMLTGLALFDYSEYYFKVSAFVWGVTFKGDPVNAGDHFMESDGFATGTPQSPLAGWTPETEVHSDLVVTHTGPSQGSVTVEVLDPMALTGHNYSVTFNTYQDTTLVPEGTEHFTYDTIQDTCAWTNIFDSVLYEDSIPNADSSVWTDTSWYEDTVWLDPILCPDTCWWTTFVDSIPNADSSVWRDTTWAEATVCIDTILDSVTTVSHDEITTVAYWDLNDVTLSTVLLSRQTNQLGDDAYFEADGLLVKVLGPDPGFLSFEVVANGAGEIDPPESGAAPWEGFPVPTDVDVDGYPTDGQQVGDGSWLFCTGSGGAGGDRGPFDVWLGRTMRGQSWWDQLGSFDFEMRFTGSNANPGVNGGYAWEAFTTGAGYWVPFELWNAGVASPDDASDDFQLIPWIYGDGGDSLYWMSAYGPQDGSGPCGPGGCEHEVSGGNNDPATDWIYWAVPQADQAGGYATFEAAMIADPTNWDGDEIRVMDRTVLVNWNGDTTADASGGATMPSGYNQDLPEVGTVFRIVTAKSNTSLDSFTFTTSAAMYSATEGGLDAINVVPNPFYLRGPYDPAIGNYQIQFTHLPEACTITIYNLAGDYIAEIDKNDASPFANWNLQSENRIPVASGIYIYVVDAPGFGQKIGKMAVFYEQEVLRLY